MIRSISFIGAGNVAHHFAKAFFKAGMTIDTILNRRLSTAKSLAVQVNAQATSSYKKLHKESDLYIIAVPDDAIRHVAEQLASVLKKDARIVHTSGAASIRALDQLFDHGGVIWPPQSLSKKKDIDFSTVPVCYGSSDVHFNAALKKLLVQATPHLQEVDDQQKLALHLAAVFANNFTNHMYSIAYHLCEKHTLDFKMLYPIILETAQKHLGQEPHVMQTGPAIRGDQSSIAKHLDLLEDKNYKSLYKLLTKSIQQYKN